MVGEALGCDIFIDHVCTRNWHVLAYPWVQFLWVVTCIVTGILFLWIFEYLSKSVRLRERGQKVDVMDTLRSAKIVWKCPFVNKTFTLRYPKNDTVCHTIKNESHAVHNYHRHIMCSNITALPTAVLIDFMNIHSRLKIIPFQISTSRLCIHGLVVSLALCRPMSKPNVYSMNDLILYKINKSSIFRSHSFVKK